MEGSDLNEFGEAARLLQQQITALEGFFSQELDEHIEFELAELSFEALNNLARCMNQMGDIDSSLQ